MGIFKNITRALKKAAPVIGSAIGMYFGGPVGASIGSGIGSLAAGRSAEEALLNAALAGGTTYAMGGKDFGKGFNFDTSGSPFASPSTTSAVTGNPITSVKTADTGGIGSFLKSMIPESTAGKIALGGAGLGLLGALGGEEKPEERPIRDYPKGTTRLGYGRIGNKLYNLDNKEEREQYFEDNRKRQSGLGTMFAAGGGEVEGPGTGTSDSVPARLSDGEFVLTAKAVRGAGGGDRNIGAARMYDMMSQLEGAA
tara:strand:- start:549 stop:1310 length:762 start_codon:yes stop_codon:yes gene_type:complete